MNYSKSQQKINCCKVDINSFRHNVQKMIRTSQEVEVIYFSACPSVFKIFQKAYLF